MARKAITAVQVQVATFAKLAGIELLSVPYKGIPATITDVIGGSLESTIVDCTGADPLVLREGAIPAEAVLLPSRGASE